MDLTVIIPTANRARLLQTALKSVARQTAANRIALVHVSENGGSRESEEVCREFPDLPIRYTFRDPRLLPNEHFKTLIKEISTPFAAVLHDDDWWAPHHLAQALTELDTHGNAVARYAAFSEVAQETSPATSDNSLSCWFGAGYPATTNSWTLTDEGMLLACLSGTPTRYSALVARRAALQASLSIYELGNTFDTDRMLAIELSRHGEILFDHVPAIFIRRHADQDGKNFSNDVSIAHMTRTTIWMIESARQSGTNIARLLSERLSACPASHLTDVLNLLRLPWCLPVLREKNLLPTVLARHAAESTRTTPRWHAVVPPVVFSIARKIRGRL